MVVALDLALAASRSAILSAVGVMESPPRFVQRSSRGIW